MHDISLIKGCLDRGRYCLVNNGNSEIVKSARTVNWMDWRTGSANAQPAVGRSLNMVPGIWLTTPISKIIEQNDRYINFITQNTNYTLFIP